MTAPVIVYGASGYTGKLIAWHLAEARIPFVAAGRSKTRLEEQMAKVPELSGADYEIIEVPHEDDLGIRPMHGFTTMWGYLLTMCTFVNSFFLSQAYGFWLATKGNVRKGQGRLNDLGMLIACHALRDGPTGGYTPASRELLEDIA